MIRLSVRRHGLGKTFYQRYTHTTTYSLREIVKKYDYTNYFCGLLFPQDHREAYFAVVRKDVTMAAVKSEFSFPIKESI